MSEKAVSEEAASEEPTSDDDRAGSDPGDEHPALAETLTSLNPAEGPGLDAATVAAFAAGRSAPRVVPERETPEGEDPILGRVLGGLYQVEHRLGEGGMGTVYRANHVHLNRPFAVKVLSERVASSQQAVERLLQEAKTASSIEHDNIVDVVSFDVTDDGRVFLVMELLRGESLADALDHGPMPLERALPLAYQVADALQAAHDAGVIHRDLKPENVFLVRKGGIEFVKVLDFGISKVQSAEAEEVRMTRTGQLVGTPLYMSPEQSRGETDVDHRADVYALGIVLYEMLTGDPPFEGTNYFQLLWKHGNEPPQPLRKRARTVPKPVDQVVLRALAKRADERFASMSAFAAALLEAAPDVRPSLPTPTSLPPAPPELPVSRTPRGLLLALGAVALIAVGFGASRLFRDAPPAPVHVATPAPPVPDAAPAP
ncbi:MAG: serine/threonine-protein kinase, partial [Myxococcota bacterium]